MKQRILIFTLPLLFACNKENSKKWTDVSITATNYITGEPISDINCGILTVDDGFFLNDKTVILDQKQMENGLYHFGFKAKKNQTYWAEASFDITKYYVISFSNYMNIANNEVNQFDFELVDPAYLKIDYLNANCEDGNDILQYRYYAKKNVSDMNYVFIFNWFELPQNGCVDQQGTSYQKLPSFNYIIEWTVQRTSGTTYGVDTILVSDTTTYILEY